MTLQRSLRAFLALAVSLGTLAALAPAPAFAASEPVHVWAPAGDQYLPRSDGRYAVWLDNRMRSHFEIWGADLTTGEEFPVSTGTADRFHPHIDDGVAIWSQRDYGCDDCQGDIVAKNLDTGEEFAVIATEAHEIRPAITGSVVVWVEAGDDVETLKGRDIAADGEPFTIATAPEGWQIDLPRAATNRVVWSEYQPLEGEEANYRLRAHDIGTGETVEIVEGTAPNRFGLQDDYDIDGDFVAWSTDMQLFLYRWGEDGYELVLTGGGCPVLDGGFIIYEDFRDFDERTRFGIQVWGYEIATGANFHIAGGPGEDHEYAHLYDGMIVWQGEGQDRDENIYGSTLDRILPTAAEPDTGGDPESYSYFTETQHALQTEFLSFWRGSGGLPVFGFPMTGEFDELNPDTGEVYRVQYLERQRFEHHPDLAGTPYEVLIGRLGVTAAERAGLLGSEAFQPVDAAPGEDCLFFNETGHSLCGRFLDYWQADGLEFGDEGVTYRESLALFGFPISEVFTDPNTGYESQYFERAIFEHHPENDGTEYEVLLRRLGVEELQSRGWCTPASPGCDPVE